MNGYEYKQNNVVFDSRLKEEISKVKREFKNGNIQTQTDYVYAVKKVVNDFYKKLGRPSFEFKKASDVPSYTEYVDMISRAKTDMNLILAGSNENYINLQAASKKTQDSIDILLNRIENINSLTESLQDKINAIRRASDVIYSDDFTKKESSSRLITDDNEAFTDVTSGALMLGVNKNNSLNSTNVSIEILNTSNGFPGNTHEIYYTIGAVNNNIKYKGENNPRINLDAIKTDNSPVQDDWFEFEMFNISQSLKDRTSLIGFNYKEGISWVTDDTELKLDLKFTVQNPIKYNHIILQAAPRENVTTSSPIVYQILISDGETAIQTLNVNQPLYETLFISFTSQIVKEVVVKIRQPESTPVKVCRQYALNIDPVKVSKYMDDEFKGFIEVDKPNKSIELLGLKYDDSNKGIIYPNTKTTNTFINSETFKNQLFYNTIADGNYHLKQEVVEADRYSIGVKQFDLKYRRYVATGTYVSKNFVSSEPIKQITLNTNDSIPESFRATLEEGEDINKFIRYFISFDEGNEWHEIYARHKAHEGPCTIMINSNTAVLNRNKNIQYIDMLDDPKEFKIKIKLSRPESILDETPVVYEYNMEVSTKEDF